MMLCSAGTSYACNLTAVRRIHNSENQHSVPLHNLCSWRGVV